MFKRNSGFVASAIRICAHRGARANPAKLVYVFFADIRFQIDMRGIQAHMLAFARFCAHALREASGPVLRFHVVLFCWRAPLLLGSSQICLHTCALTRVHNCVRARVRTTMAHLHVELRMRAHLPYTPNPSITARAFKYLRPYAPSY